MIARNIAETCRRLWGMYPILTVTGPRQSGKTTLVKERLNSGKNGDLYYMRTSHGVEIDIVLENAGKLDLTEIKAGETFHDEMTNNLRSIARLLPNEVGKLAVVYAGRGASASGGIPVLSFEKMDC